MNTIKSGNTILISDRILMFIPQGGPHARQCYITVPYIFKKRPVVNVTISTEQSSTPYVVYGVQDAKATGETSFKITAINIQIGNPDEHEYYCDFMMMGELAHEKK